MLKCFDYTENIFKEVTDYYGLALKGKKHPSRNEIGILIALKNTNGANVASYNLFIFDLLT